MRKSDKKVKGYVIYKNGKWVVYKRNYMTAEEIETIEADENKLRYFLENYFPEKTIVIWR